jgi:hypothetical protein
MQQNIEYFFRSFTYFTLYCSASVDLEGFWFEEVKSAMRTYSSSSPGRFALLPWMPDFGFRDRFPWLLRAVFFAISIFGLMPILVGCGSGVVITGANSLLISPGTLDFGDVSHWTVISKDGCSFQYGQNYSLGLSD